MLFLHYAVFVRKQKTHKRRTKCSILQKFTKAKALLEIPLQTDTWILHAVILKIVSLYHLSLSAAWAAIGTLRDKVWRETIFKINAQQFYVSISSTSSFFFLQKTQPNIIMLPNFENGKYLIAYACLNICLCSSLISCHYKSI